MTAFDPIVEEVRRVREALAAKFNVDAIFADLQQKQAALGKQFVSPRSPKRTPAEPDLAAHGVSCDQNTPDVGISR